MTDTSVESAFVATFEFSLEVITVEARTDVARCYENGLLDQAFTGRMPLLSPNLQSCQNTDKIRY